MYQPNDKIYVGKTYTKERKRKKQHKYDAYTKQLETPFANAIRKYGWEKTLSSYKVLETIYSDDLQDLNIKLIEKENHWINTLNTIVPNGYNVHFSNHEKIPTILNREEKNNKISKALKGKYMNSTSTSKRVMCIDTGIIYPSISECERQMNFCRGSVSSVLNGKQYAHLGYRFKYVDESNDKIIKEQNIRNKPIRCIETGEVFDTAREISYILTGDKEKIRGNILASCKHGWACRGKHYEFV